MNRYELPIDTIDVAKREMAIKALQFITKYEAQHGIEPDSILIAAHITGEDIDLDLIPLAAHCRGGGGTEKTRQLSRTGRQLSEILLPLMDDYYSNRYLDLSDAIGCRDDINASLTKHDSEHPEYFWYSNV